MKRFVSRYGFIVIFVISFFLFSGSISAITCEYTFISDANTTVNRPGYDKIKIVAKSEHEFLIYGNGNLVCDYSIIDKFKCSADAVRIIVEQNKCIDYILSYVDSHGIIYFSSGTLSNHNYTVRTIKEELCSYSARESDGTLVAVRCVDSDCTLLSGLKVESNGASCTEYKYLEYSDGTYKLTNDPSNASHISYKYKQELTKKVSCMGIDNIPARLPDLTSKFVNIIKIVVPVILVIMGMIDFAKAVISQKDDEIKKGQKIFIKRLIAAAAVFFVIVITQMLVNFVASDEAKSIIECMNCFLNYDC